MIRRSHDRVAADDVNSKSTNTPSNLSLEPIAITGICCRFPGGAHSPKAFWDLLTRGGEGIVAIPRAGMDDYPDL